MISKRLRALEIRAFDPRRVGSQSKSVRAEELVTRRLLQRASQSPTTENLNKLERSVVRLEELRGLDELTPDEIIAHNRVKYIPHEIKLLESHLRHAEDMLSRARCPASKNKWSGEVYFLKKSLENRKDDYRRACQLMGVAS